MHSSVTSVCMRGEWDDTGVRPFTHTPCALGEKQNHFPLRRGCANFCRSSFIEPRSLFRRRQSKQNIVILISNIVAACITLTYIILSIRPGQTCRLLIKVLQPRAPLIFIFIIRRELRRVITRRMRLCAPEPKLYHTGRSFSLGACMCAPRQSQELFKRTHPHTHCSLGVTSIKWVPQNQGYGWKIGRKGCGGFVCANL